MFPFDSINNHPDFSQSSLIMNILPTGTEDITSKSGLTLTTPIEYTCTSNNFINKTATYSILIFTYYIKNKIIRYLLSI